MTDNLDLAQQLHSICPDLAAHIARCCEQAYRRGYQQGALGGHGLNHPQITSWRFDVPDAFSEDPAARYSLSTCPPNTKGWCFRSTALERLSWEAANASPLISHLADFDA